jgi:hypothetical protein
MLGGRLADLLGRRRMFVIGLLLFAVASLAGGLAQSEGWLIAARAVQGLGGALLSPAALSLLTVIFAEGAERNRALGRVGRGGGLRRCGRRPARRHAHPVGRLGMGAVRERPGRLAGRPVRAPHPARVAHRR